MNIVMLLRKAFPPDVRVRREAKYLAEMGHDVTVVCGRSSQKPMVESLDGFTVRRVRTHSTPIQLGVELVNLASVFYVDHYRTLSTVVSEKEIDLIHAHDLPMLRTAYLVSRQYDIPVVADLHELYPESLKEWRKGTNLRSKLKPSYFLRPRLRFQLLEKRLLPRVDGVITVSDLAVEHYLKKYNLNPATTGKVRNVVDVERFDKYSADTIDFDSDFVVSFIGNFTPQRGLITAIDAVSAVQDEVPTIHLVLVGSGSAEFTQKLRERAKKKGVSDRVEFTGWVDYSRLPSYFTASDVSLSTVTTDSIDSQVGLANKTFQIMASSTPVISTSVEATAQIINDADCGVVVDPYSPDDLSDVFIKLYYNKKRRQEMGENGREKVETEYNFGSEVGNLVSVYREVLSIS